MPVERGLMITRPNPFLQRGIGNCQKRAIFRNAAAPCFLQKEATRPAKCLLCPVGFAVECGGAAGLRSGSSELGEVMRPTASTERRTGLVGHGDIPSAFSRKVKEELLPMTMKLELTPELQAGLLAQAKSNGLSL